MFSNHWIIFFIILVRASSYFLWSYALPTAVVEMALLPTYLISCWKPVFFKTLLIRGWTKWKAPPLKFYYWTQKTCASLFPFLRILSNCSSGKGNNYSIAKIDVFSDLDSLTNASMSYTNFPEQRMIVLAVEILSEFKYPSIYSNFEPGPRS